jgi:hypothetical protein
MTTQRPSHGCLAAIAGRSTDGVISSGLPQRCNRSHSDRGSFAADDGRGVSSLLAHHRRSRKLHVRSEHCDPMGKLATAHPRHHHIGQEQIGSGRELLGSEDRFGTVLSLQYVVAVTAKDRALDRAHLVVVLDEQDRLGPRGGSSLRSRSAHIAACCHSKRRPERSNRCSTPAPLPAAAAE